MDSPHPQPPPPTLLLLLLSFRSSCGSTDADGKAILSAVFLTSPVDHRVYRPTKRVVRGECRSVTDYEKLGRLGEGTYGIV
jgi:hypothetical protein